MGGAPWALRASAAGAALALLLAAPAGSATRGTTERVSVDSAGRQAQGESISPSISADGRFVAFSSLAPLVAGDTNGLFDVFVRDRARGVTERVSVPQGGGQSDGESLAVALSADGTVVAFDSDATNLVPGDTDDVRDVFVHDRTTGLTERVSGPAPSGGAFTPAISGDGRFVSFHTDGGLFVHDRRRGTTTRVDVSPTGAPADGFGCCGAFSRDGRFLAFSSDATNLVPEDTNGGTDVFVRDLRSGRTERVSVRSGGGQANNQPGFTVFPTISADGRFVAFDSHATNLVPGDTNGLSDVFVHDRATNTTERVSVASSGAQAAGESFLSVVSGDGRFVAFVSSAPNLVAGDTNGALDVFLRDRLRGTTERVNVDPAGAQTSGDVGAQPDLAIGRSGRFVAFTSRAPDVVPGDTNGVGDVFLRDRGAGPACTIRGTAGGDRLLGTPGDDVVCAGGGDDSVSGLGGDDVLFGGAGDDVVIGGGGSDTVAGGGGDDVLEGGRGNDALSGGAGADSLFGEGGNDLLRARDGIHGNDLASGGDGRDACRVDPGDRRLGCP